MVDAPCHRDTGIIVVIPAYNEPDLKKTLESLLESELPTGLYAEVIIVLNESELDDPSLKAFHAQQKLELEEWAKNNSRDSRTYFHIIHASGLLHKYAGVGLARKIGMDEAAKRLISIGNSDVVILCTDADVRVESNYLEAVIQSFANDPSLRAASIYFEHDLEDPSLPDEAIQAIIQYESHLRYHINMQRIIGLPFAYHTVGSAMAVRSSAYIHHFGMNKRKAGEDFYFLHKFISTGAFKTINGTTVFPSARYSGRVPFGTGRTVSKLAEEDAGLESYNYLSYLKLQEFLRLLPELYRAPESVKYLLSPEINEFFGDQLFQRRNEMVSHTKSYEAFRKRFFGWFDAFMLIKFLHFCRDNYYKDIPIGEAVNFLLKKLQLEDQNDAYKNLLTLRKIDKEGLVDF